MSLQLQTIAKRLRRKRKGASFNFLARMEVEAELLQSHYGEDGAAAATVLEDVGGIGVLVVKSAIRHLAFLGVHYRKRRANPGTSALATKLHEAWVPWWVLAYEIKCERSHEPYTDDLGIHPKKTGDWLVDRFINVCAIELATMYHEDLYETAYGPRKRGEEHDVLLARFRNALPKFAQSYDNPETKKHLDIAKAHYTHEPVRTAFSDRPLVLLGPQAFMRELTGKSPSTSVMFGRYGESFERDQVQSYIRCISELETYGEWGKAKDPSKAVAMARAISMTQPNSMTFNVNLTFIAFGRATNVLRATASALQDKLRKLLKREFGVCPEFYFVVEQGLDQKPHIHGAIALESTDSNEKRLRKVLIALAEPIIKGSTKRAVALDTLYNPGRWGRIPSSILSQRNQRPASVDC